MDTRPLKRALSPAVKASVATAAFLAVFAAMLYWPLFGLMVVLVFAGGLVSLALLGLFVAFYDIFGGEL